MKKIFVLFILISINLFPQFKSDENFIVYYNYNGDEYAFDAKKFLLQGGYDFEKKKIIFDLNDVEGSCKKNGHNVPFFEAMDMIIENTDNGNDFFRFFTSKVSLYDDYINDIIRQKIINGESFDFDRIVNNVYSGDYINIDFKDMEQVVITFKKIDTIRNICISYYRSSKHPSNNLIQNKNTITAPFYILFPICKDGLFINSEFYNLSPNDLKAFFVIKNGDYK